MNPTVTILIPTYNEEHHVQRLVENLLSQDYPRNLMEVFVIDGQSKDKTREILSSYAVTEHWLHLLVNPLRYVPYALNEGIRRSTGEIIIRMDAHAVYPENYISILVQRLNELQADNVGGVWDSQPGDNSIKALAIARVTSSVFGVGNAFYRIGATSIQEVNTVPFGCYRRELFDRIGMFDEAMNRNQDDEFNARLTKNGGRIFLLPELVITYYARKTIRAIMRMFWLDGLYKPLVVRKIGRPTTVRQFIPVAFVLYLLGLPLFFLIWPGWGFFAAAGVGLYILADLWFSFRILADTRTPACLLYTPWLFLLVHICYGTGYLVGIFRFILFGKK